MTQVLPAERGLRRVIGDGDAVPDGEVDGLDERELLELHRSMVLLRTYDERSLVYHRQGRIGTYVIFWNHEAMQAGSVHALDDEDWIFPSYRESAIGLLRGTRRAAQAAGVTPSRPRPDPPPRRRQLRRRVPQSRGSSGGTRPFSRGRTRAAHGPRGVKNATPAILKAP
jgi:hypothetical protein